MIFLNYDPGGKSREAIIIYLKISSLIKWVWCKGRSAPASLITSWDMPQSVWSTLRHTLASRLWPKHPEHKGVQTTSVMFLHKLLKKK